MEHNLFSQIWVNANGFSGENIARHTDIPFANFDATAETAIFANITEARFGSGIHLDPTGGVVCFRDHW